MDKSTRNRAINQRSKILDMLRAAGPLGITNVELSKVGLRFQSRLHELYIQGYVVNTVQLEGGLNKYVLISEPEVPKDEPPKAVDVLIDEINSNYRGFVSADELKLLLEEKHMSVQRKGGSYKKNLA